MRMRKKKNGQARLDACRERLLSASSLPMENPAREMSAEADRVYLEIGAGKGGFACEMARREPSAAYFAMERVTDCVVLCAERAESGEYGELPNLKFINDTADNLLSLFALGTVDKIFLNFSDPWPKKGYAKRRLTHRRYLALYINLLSDGGEIRFKTDNVGLFDFTLEEISSLGLTPEVVTRDLHASEYNAGNVMTEYERSFSEQGMKINMLTLKKPEGFSVELPYDFTEDGRRRYLNGRD